MTIEPPLELPHNIDAEQALLGCLLIHNNALERVEALGAEDFFDPLHARIFEEIVSRVSAGRLATPVSLKTAFERDAPITDELTVPQYLGRLAANAASIAHIAEYAKTTIDLAKRRQLVEIGQWIVREAFQAPLQEPADQQIEAAEGALYQIAETGRRSVAEATFAAAASEAVNAANEAYRSKGTARGLATGLVDLDAKLGGMQPSDLIILAGRPSMGKTALATNIAWHSARHGRISVDGEPIAAPIHFFSLEMSAEQLATRILSSEIEVPSEKLRRGAVEECQIRDLIAAEQQLRDVPLIIDPTGGISIAQLAARARRMKRRRGTALIVVDYLQLMTGAQRRGGNRVEEVTEITTGLKALAKELQVPILALSQLSRQVEGRTEKRPQLSDLRESGSIEQDADVVLFVYREEWKRVERSLSASEHVFGIVLKSGEELTQLANEARIDVEAYTKTYIRTAAAIRDFGYDSKVAAEVTSTLAKALKLGSASASEQASTILQFSQALQKGKLDGDEFRTVMENAGVVQELLAKRLNVTKGKIVEMAAAGKLKLRELVEAMREGKELIDRVFSGQAVTLDEAFIVLRNSVIEYTGKVDKAYDVTKNLSSAVAFLGRNIETVGDVALIAGTALLAMFGPALLARVGLFAVSMATATSPLRLVAGLGAAAAAGISLFGDKIAVSKDGVVTLKDAVNALANGIGGVNRELTENAKRWEEARKAGLAATVVESFNQAVFGPLRRAQTGGRETALRRGVEEKDFGGTFRKYLDGRLRENKIETPGDEASERSRKAFDKDLVNAENRLELARKEAETIGQSTYEIERQRTAQGLVNEARKAGLTLSDDDLARVDAIADATGRMAAQITYLQTLQGKRDEAEELENELRLTGLYGKELEKARVQQELLVAAKRAGKELTPELERENELIAERIASNKELLKIQSDIRDQSQEALSTFIKSVRDGASATEALGNALTNISDKLIDMAVSGLVEAALGPLFNQGGSGGGLLSGLIGGKGFAAGGMVRGPGTGISDSVPARLSNGEYVVNAEAAKKHHPLLDAINGGAAAPGFAKGGAVNVPNVSVPTAAAGSAAPQISMNVTMNIANGTPEGVDKLKTEIVPLMKRVAQGVMAEAFDRKDAYRRMKG